MLSHLTTKEHPFVFTVTWCPWIWLEANNWTSSNKRRNHQQLWSYVLMAHNILNGINDGEANFIFPLCNTGTFYHLYSWILRSTAVLFLFIINMRSAFRGGEGNHTYSLVGQSTDMKKLCRRLLCCIHDRLAFNDVVARRSCASYWRQLTASLPAAAQTRAAKFAHAHCL